MKNLGKIINPYDIPTKEYVDPAILVVNQQYTEEELDEIFSLHKRVLIQLSGSKLPVLTFSKATSQYIFYCFLNPTTNYRIDYDFTGNHWFLYPTTLAQKNSPTFTGTPTAPTPTNNSDGTQIVTKEYVDPVILDTTKTYTYEYFKSLADANRRVKIDNNNISRVLASTTVSYFNYTDGVTDSGYYKYNHTVNQWEYNETPLATLTLLNNFVPTKIKNQEDVAISIWTGTQEEYDALTTKDANTLYYIIE